MKTSSLEEALTQLMSEKQQVRAANWPDSTASGSFECARADAVRWCCPAHCGVHEDVHPLW